MPKAVKRKSHQQKISKIWKWLIFFVIN